MPENITQDNSVSQTNNPPLAETPPIAVPAQQKPNLFFIAIIIVIILGAVAGIYFGVKPLIEKPITETNPPNQLSDSGVFKIGGILPLTGDSAAYGIPLQQSAFAAQKEINQNGGINGRMIEFIWKDGKCQEEEARTAAMQLVNEENVDALISGACSSETLASAPIAQEKKVINFSSAATSPNVSKLGRYVFRTCPSDALAGQVAAEYAYTKIGARTAGIIYQDKDYPLQLKEIFEKKFTELGGEVLFSEVFETGAADFSSIGSNAVQQNPDVIYVLPQSPTPGVLLIAELKAQGSTSKILTAEALIVRDSVQEQGNVLEGVTGVEALFDDSRPKTQHFLNLYKNEFNLEPAYPSYMAGTYDSLYLIKEAFEAGGGDPDKAADFLYNLRDWNGAVGDISFSSNGDPTMPYSIIYVTNFETNPIDTITPSI